MLSSPPMPPTGDYSGNRSKRSRTESRGSVGPEYGDDLLRFPKSTLTRQCRLPKRYLDDFSTVSAVSVPRKLRSSAMKKKMNDGDGNGLLGSNNNGLMKSKLKKRQVESEGCVAGTMSEEGVSMDEVEVAEALFALSGGLGGKSSALDETCVPSSVDAGRSGDDLGTDNHPTDSVLDTVNQPPSEKLACCSKPEVNLHLTAFVSEKQPAICDSISGAWTQIRKTRSKSSTLDVGQTYNHQDTALAPNADASRKTDKNGGSSSKRNPPSSFPSRSPITKFPARTGITTLKATDTAEQNALFSAYSKNSWRRSCTHAYVCRYIKAFRENNEKMMQSSTMNEVPNQRDQSGASNSLIDVSSNSTEGENAMLLHTSPEQNAAEVENAIHLHNMLVKDQQPASEGLRLLRKHAAKQKALQAKNQAYNTSFPPNQNLYSSTSSSGHIPIAPGLQVQLPPYFAGSYVPYTDTNALTVQSFEQQHGNQLLPLLMANFDPSLAALGKQTVGPFFHPGRASFQQSLPTFEAHGYTQILQQQQQQRVSSNAIGPYHHLPSGYDANAGQGRPDKLMLHHCR